MIHQPSGGGRGTSADLEIMAVQMLKVKQMGIGYWLPIAANL